MKLLALSVGIAAGVLSGCAEARKVSPLGTAIEKGDAAGAASILERGESADAYVDNKGMLALVDAVTENRPDIVRLLLKRGAQVNKPGDEYGWTPLHQAAQMGNSTLIGFLVEAGADLSAVTKEGNTPEMIARIAGKKSAAEQLARLRAAAPVAIAAKPLPARVSAPAAERPAERVALLPNYAAAPQPEDFAVVVGIENYPDLPAATYAERDAAAYRRFVVALGVPERNIMALTGARATRTGLEKALEAWLPNNVSEKSKVYFYYSGHGAPDIKTGDAYLVPADGDPKYLAQTGYPLKRLYAKLGELKAKSVVVTLDSCFSGAGGRSVLPKGARPLIGKVDAGAAPSKVVVLSASAGDEASGADDEAGYGLFTYNLLQGLNGAAKDEQGKVTVKSLYSYLKPRVQDGARRDNRDQTPQLQGGDGVILRDR